MYENTIAQASKYRKQCSSILCKYCVNTIGGDKGFCYKPHMMVHSQTARARLQTFLGCLGSLLQIDCETGTRYFLTFPVFEQNGLCDRMAMGAFPRHGGVPFADETVQGWLKHAEGQRQETARVSPYSQRGVSTDLGLSLSI